MAFKMRSGNSPLFKMIGSSPAKDLDPHTGEDGHTHEGYTAGEEQLISDEGGVKTYRTDYTKPGGASGGFIKHGMSGCKLQKVKIGKKKIQGVNITQ